MANNRPKKCLCGKKAGFCDACSLFKFVFMVKNGNDHLKYLVNGVLACPAWYNYVKQNNYPEEYLFNGVKRRFYENKQASPSQFNLVKVYHSNGTFYKNITP